MSKPHDLLDAITTWAQRPDKWQWRFYRASQNEWIDCTPWDALEFHAAGTRVAILPKRNMIPADRLPEGWEVERNPAGTYFVKSPKFHGYVESERTTHNDAPSAALHQFLRHIDPEARS